MVHRRRMDDCFAVIQIVGDGLIAMIVQMWGRPPSGLETHPDDIFESSVKYVAKFTNFPLCKIRAHINAKCYTFPQ